MAWDRHKLLWGGMGMGQINMSLGQPCILHTPANESDWKRAFSCFFLPACTAPL